MKFKVINGVIWVKGIPYEKGAILSSPPFSKEEFQEIIKLSQKYPNFFEVMQEEVKEKKIKMKEK